jgi:hypothetical protein
MVTLPRIAICAAVELPGVLLTCRFGAKPSSDWMLVTPRREMASPESAVTAIGTSMRRCSRFCAVTTTSSRAASCWAWATRCEGEGHGERDPSGWELFRIVFIFNLLSSKKSEERNQKKYEPPLATRTAPVT